MKAGRKLGKGRCPLMYEWHGKKYWGAAHGLAGIVHVLMDMELTPEEQEDVKSVLRYMIRGRFPSGNYPSSEGSDSDRLVHWCHGAPGLALTLAKASQVKSIFCISLQTFSYGMSSCQLSLFPLTILDKNKNNNKKYNKFCLLYTEYYVPFSTSMRSFEYLCSIIVTLCNIGVLCSSYDELYWNVLFFLVLSLIKIGVMFNYLYLFK